MAHKNTIPVEIEAHGFEDAAEKIELMADAIDSLPATVNIKAKDCEINIQSTNYIEQEETISSFSKGGVLTKDKDITPPGGAIFATYETREVSEVVLKGALRTVKNKCKLRGDTCKGCFLHDEEEDECLVRKDLPEDWKL